MADQNATPTKTGRKVNKGQRPRPAVTSELVGKLDALIASQARREVAQAQGGAPDASPDAVFADIQLRRIQSRVVAARPDSAADALASLMALHSEMFRFTEYSVLQDLSPEAKEALDRMEQRWTRGVRNIIGFLSRAGVTVPPAFDGYFDTKAMH